MLPCVKALPGRHAGVRVKTKRQGFATQQTFCAGDYFSACPMSVQMGNTGLAKESVGKPMDAEGGVSIEDFRGDSATDDITRQAVIKDIVDIEQKGVYHVHTIHH